MKWKEGAQYENPPAGSHIARCTGLVDLGTQTHSWNNETWTSRDVKLVWELPNERMTGCYNDSQKGKPFLVSMTVKASMHSSSKLRKLLEGWRGRKFTKEETQTFEPKKLLGQACRLALIENGEYVNIQGISPLGKGEVCPKQINPSLYFSLEESEFDNKVFSSLPERTKEKIQKSPEFAKLTGGDGEEPPVDASDGPPDENEPW